MKKQSCFILEAWDKAQAAETLVKAKQEEGDLFHAILVNDNDDDIRVNWTVCEVDKMRKEYPLASFYLDVE